MNDSARALVLFEDLASKMDLLVEIVTVMKDQVARIPIIEEDIAALKSDMKIVKIVVTENNQEIRNLDRRVTLLESMQN
jgi:hypothetical protein